MFFLIIPLLALGFLGIREYRKTNPSLVPHATKVFSVVQGGLYQVIFHRPASDGPVSQTVVPGYDYTQFGLTLVGAVPQPIVHPNAQPGYIYYTFQGKSNATKPLVLTDYVDDMIRIA